jgi:hypothetical protein
MIRRKIIKERKVYTYIVDDLEGSREGFGSI